MPNALDHRGVVQRIGKNDTARDLARQCPKRGPVGYVTRSKKKRGLLLVQVGQLALEQNMFVSGARNIPRASGPRAAAVERIMHRRKNFRMLSHAEVVVGAPDGDFTLCILAGVLGLREIPAAALQISKDAIVPLVTQIVQTGAEIGLIVHVAPLEAVLFHTFNQSRPVGFHDIGQVRRFRTLAPSGQIR